LNKRLNRGSVEETEQLVSSAGTEAGDANNRGSFARLELRAIALFNSRSAPGQSQL
jgi:hypothetical protein